MSDEKRKFREELKLTREGKLSNPLKTHLRDMIILPDMIGLNVLVHNGKEFVSFTIRPEMVGHYLGEFSITNKRVQHRITRCRIISFKFVCSTEVIKMPNYSYSFENYEKSRHVRSSLRDKSISHKHSREIALAIKGKSIEKAREFLGRCII